MPLAVAMPQSHQHAKLGGDKRDLPAFLYLDNKGKDKI